MTRSGGLTAGQRCRRECPQAADANKPDGMANRWPSAGCGQLRAATVSPRSGDPQTKTRNLPSRSPLSPATVPRAGSRGPPGYRPDAKTEAEEEAQDEWDEVSTGVAEPEVFSQYISFRQHVDCTLAGRKVNNALDAVKRTAIDYTAERFKLEKGVRSVVDRELLEIEEDGKGSVAATLFQTIEPSEKYPKGRSTFLPRFRSWAPEIETKARELLGHIRSSRYNADLVKKFRKLTTAQNNLKPAFVPWRVYFRRLRNARKTCQLGAASN